MMQAYRIESDYIIPNKGHLLTLDRGLDLGNNTSVVLDGVKHKFGIGTETPYIVFIGDIEENENLEDKLLYYDPS